MASRWVGPKNRGRWPNTGQRGRSDGGRGSERSELLALPQRIGLFVAAYSILSRIGAIGASHLATSSVCAFFPFRVQSLCYLIASHSGRGGYTLRWQAVLMVLSTVPLFLCGWNPIFCGYDIDLGCTED
ncbi:hypothetical protein F5146DRAFT_201493 [Armillaria mellea]|nr:hypothetical protein F5146DRAFT_201493 [Armillaria mellea]